MLLASAIIILREVLEAALLLSVLLAVSRFCKEPLVWVYFSVLAGLVGAVGYGLAYVSISNLFEGVGAEVINAVMQMMLYGCLLIVVCSLASWIVRVEPASAILRWSMGLAMALAVTREGSEVFIFLKGYVQASDGALSIVLGVLIGAGIGAGIGALFYFLLLTISRRSALRLGCALLILVGAGMCLQAVQLLEQADWLPSQYPVWDSSGLVSENSISGQLLYALVSYEATPTPIQLAVYGLSAVSMLLPVLHIYRRNSRVGSR